MRRHGHRRAASAEAPSRDKRLKRSPVKANPSAVELVVLRCNKALMPMNVRERDVQVVQDPVSLGIVDRRELHRQRTIGPVVLSDESVRLQPTSERALTDVVKV